MRDGTAVGPTAALGTDELLERAAQYVQSVRSASGSAARARTVLDRAGATSLITLMRSLPTVEAQFSGSAAGRELRGWFGPGRLVPADRAPVAVLRLPSTSSEYRRGRSRQALRTNLAAAARSGITAHGVTGDAELHRICSHIAVARRIDPDAYLSRHVHADPHSVLAAAYDADGQPLGVSRVVVDGAWAGLSFLVTAIDHGESQLARYVLQAHMAGVLIEQGVQSLAVGGSMLLSGSGIRYFQRRTGFEPVRLRLLPQPVRGASIEQPSGAPGVAHSPQAAREVAWIQSSRVRRSSAPVP